MNIRPYEIHDYMTLFDWWTAHKWTAPAIDMLPRVGLVVDDICAGFLYQTDSKIAWLEFIVSNPKSDKYKREEALDLLISSCINQAKDMGFKAIFTSVKHPKLKERYVQHGFTVGDEGTTEMFRRI